jgi:uncharacterized protein (TIGR02145 family)
MGSVDATSLDILTKELRSIAVKALPNFDILAQEVIMKRLGGSEGYLNACRESEGCIAELGKKAEVEPAPEAPKSAASGSLLTDSRDGKKYKTVKIGSQTWMAENLNYNASGSECYDNKTENCNKYGRLFDWKTAKTACPSGWHLPSDGEWTKLTEHVGSKTAGKQLKAKSGWDSNGNGTDAHGFAALPGGYRHTDGSFGNAGYYGFWWSSSEDDASYAYFRYMYYDDDYAGWNGYDKAGGFSVRCLQD